MTELKNVQDTVSEFLKKLRQESAETLTKAEKEVKGFVETLVEKRKITEADGRKIYNELSGKVKKGREDFEKRIDEGTKWILAYMKLPSKTEVEKLSKRVNDLERKVKSLKTVASKKGK